MGKHGAAIVGDGAFSENYKFKKLLDDLCIDWGFFGVSCDEFINELRRRGSLDADEFATLVLVADGFNPELDIAYRRRIRRLIIERFGSQEIQVTDWL